MNTPSYQITFKNRIIEINLCGDWNPVIDLMYMAELSEVVKKANSKKWAILFDMSKCHIHANTIASSIADTLATDRRNQLLEVWVVNHAEQGDFLLNFGSTSKVKIHKCFCVEEARKYLQKHGPGLSSSTSAMSY